MHESTELSTSQAERRPYAPPRLTRYGSIHELTAALNSGPTDGVLGTISICSTFPC